MSFPSSCCLQGFKWEDEPCGRIDKLSTNNAYITGTNPTTAVLLIHDLFGWTFPNIRLLADHYARGIDATVYVPDFFGGEVLPFDSIAAERWHEFDLHGFVSKNSRGIREGEIFACARVLREKYHCVAAVGFCYGGWAVYRLGSQVEEGIGGRHRPLVDCITAGHPSLLTKKDIDEVAVPVQMLAPEVDEAFNAELKLYTFTTLQRKSVLFDYLHLPGVKHGCLVRGDPGRPGERDAMIRGKNAVVAWVKQFVIDAD